MSDFLVEAIGFGSDGSNRIYTRDYEDIFFDSRSVRMTLSNMYTAYSRSIYTAQHEIHVSKTGHDTTGDGTSSKPYLTIKKALSVITDNGPTSLYTILVHPGIYTEANPVQMKNYVDIVSVGGRFSTAVTCSSPNNHLFMGANACSLVGLNLGGATTNPYSSVAMAQANSIMAVKDCLLSSSYRAICTNAATSTIIVGGTSASPTGTFTYVFCVLSGTIVLYDVMIGGIATAERGINCSGANSMLRANGVLITSANVTDGVYIDDGADFQFSGGGIQNCTNAVHFGATGNAHAHFKGMVVESATYDFKIDASTHTIRSETDLDRDKLYDPYSVLENLGFDDYAEVYRMKTDVRGGTEQRGRRFTWGEGGSYTYGIEKWSYNGSVYTKITGDNLTFPNTSANTALYFGKVDPATVKFTSLDYLMNATKLVKGAGSLVWEYYDGGALAWVAFKTMTTIYGGSTLQTEPFIGDENSRYTVRFDQDVITGVTESNVAATGWVVNQPDASMTSCYWVRCRIVTGITTAPTFSYLKLRGNFCTIRENGTQAFSGEGRSLRLAPLEIGNENSNAANSDVAISANITYPYTKNSLNNAALNNMFFRFIVPDDCDISCGLSVNFDLNATVGYVAGNDTAKLHFYSSVLDRDTMVFNGANTEVHQEFDFTVHVGDPAYRGRTYTMAHRINISASKPGGEVFMKLERLANELGDSLLGDVRMTNAFIEYRSWQTGTSE